MLWALGSHRQFMSFVVCRGRKIPKAIVMTKALFFCQANVIVESTYNELVDLLNLTRFCLRKLLGNLKILAGLENFFILYDLLVLRSMNRWICWIQLDFAFGSCVKAIVWLEECLLSFCHFTTWSWINKIYYCFID